MNSYIIGCSETGDGIYVDPGASVGHVIETAERIGVRLIKLVGTHAHLDHAEGVAEVKERLNLPYWLHKDELYNLQNMPAIARGYGLTVPEVPVVDEFLVPGEFFKVGKLTFDIRLTDGHAPGNITLYRPGNNGKAGHAFVGDTLFAGSIGRTDLYMGNTKKLLYSVRTQLLTLPPDTLVFPGHGNETTIGDEIVSNPFCQPGAENLFP